MSCYQDDPGARRERRPGRWDAYCARCGFWVGSSTACAAAGLLCYSCLLHSGLDIPAAVRATEAQFPVAGDRADG